MARFVLGDGGHGRVIAYLTGGHCLGPHDRIPEEGELFIGVGDPPTRRALYERFGARVMGVVGQTAIYGAHTTTGAALQLLDRAFVNINCRIGANVLINTGAQIDHDCVIGDHCVISPGAILCGNVTLGPECFIGAGAIIIPGVMLDAGTYVSAGTLVVGPDDFRRPARVLRDH